ncbi:hypothetical protein [Leptotrichia trevisanii]|uniref:hypothetical protein n=1 Tax=Leptotrichia trevisanii TaxID=109328 RepID=UPI0003F5EB52|nr:hypothetical protein [Leptotrichia trevisanii]
MKAAVLLSPVNKDGVNIGFFNSVLRKFKKNPVPLGETFIGDAGVSEILLLPVYVDTVEYLKYDAENMKAEGDVQLMMMKKSKGLSESKYDFLSFAENSVIKIGGKIVFLNFENEAKSEKEKNAFGEEMLDEKDLTAGIQKYSEMGKEEKKRFRQKVGKKLIEYGANLRTINQLSEWAMSNDIPQTENEQKKGFEILKRDPSQPAEAYRGITKSLTIVYFKDDKPMEKKSEAKKWDREKDAEKEYEYAQIQKRLTAIENAIETLDNNIKGALEEKEKRDLNKSTLLKKYGSEDAMKQRYNELVDELQTPDDRKDMLEAEKGNIENALKNDMKDIQTLEQLQKYRTQQNKLIEEKEEIKRDKLKGQANYEAYKEQEDLKNWTESLLGIELDMPLRYMYVPEVELVSYSESMDLSESEGRFEVLLKQSFKRKQYVEVGDPTSLGLKQGGKLIESIGKIFGVGSDGKVVKKGK